MKKQTKDEIALLKKLLQRANYFVQCSDTCFYRETCRCGANKLGSDIVKALK